MQKTLGGDETLVSGLERASLYSRNRLGRDVLWDECKIYCAKYHFINGTEDLVNGRNLLLVGGEERSIELGNLIMLHLLEYEHIVSCGMEKSREV